MDRMDDFVARYPTADAGSAPGTAIDSSNPYFSGYVLKQLDLNDQSIEREFFSFASTCELYFLFLFFLKKRVAIVYLKRRRPN